MYPKISKALLDGDTTSTKNNWVRQWPKSRPMILLLTRRQQEPKIQCNSKLISSKLKRFTRLQQDICLEVRLLFKCRCCWVSFFRGNLKILLRRQMERHKMKQKYILRQNAPWYLFYFKFLLNALLVIYYWLVMNE